MKKILDWNKYLETAAKAVAEGIVMLKNDNNALPLDSEEEISVFGRIQLNYYKSGTGSGRYGKRFKGNRNSRWSY